MEDQSMCSIDLVGSLADEIFQVCFVGGVVPRGVNFFFLLCFLCYNLRPKKCSCSLLKFIHNVMNYEHIHNVM